eukprot:GHVU01217016.1.p1 GENE.GHVU01217016.1~~GHVU01217016.1.p1  ORF type:complete len:407 (-),score=86.40 GHVU01217016.1:955-2175(-)
MQCMGSCLTNKYAEGQPGARYYGGNLYIDQIEELAKTRTLKAFNLDTMIWDVNVQPYSGSPANFAVYTGLLKPHDRVMGLDLPHGGHLTHGFYAGDKKISATSLFFESLPYRLDINTGLIDYVKLREQAKLFRPKMIIAGTSAYSRLLDYKEFRSICDEVGAYLFADMAHIAGLVAAGSIPSPFEYADVVSTTTHKTLRGPRAGMVFFNKGKHPDIKNKIDMAIFPGLQGGPHEHAIAAIATQMREVAQPEWKAYADQVITNSRHLAAELAKKGYKIVSGGTDTHVFLWDLGPVGLSGSKVEKVCEECEITLNKNTVPGDASAMNPSGVRIGTAALTTRNFTPAEFSQVAEFLHEAVTIALKLQEQYGKKLVDFKEGMKTSDAIPALKAKVEAFSSKFPMPGSQVL